jgi:hypothetical protein
MGAHAGLTGADARRTRAIAIRDAAAARGLDNGLLLAGIANAETGLSQCHSELSWACEGPYSAECGGPVVAGAADGPCSDRKGGLGMFQFDAGNYDDTLAREGDRILTVAGNVDAAIDFVLAMVRRSEFIDGVESDDDALAFMNAVRPWNDLWTPWIKTVTRYYNGCIPGVCSAYDARFASYSSGATDLVKEMGAELWFGRAPLCGPIPPAGATLDDTDGCFFAGGDLAYWRTETAGYAATLLWTNATSASAYANYAGYRLELAQAGRYRVEVYVDLAFAESMMARYELVHAGVTDAIAFDQAFAGGFRELGTYEFNAGDDQWLRVFDDTGEPVDTMTHIVIDAIRLTREDVVGDGPDGDPVPDDAGLVDADGGSPDAGVPAFEPGESGGAVAGGCRAAPASSALASFTPMLLVLAAATGRRRRRQH